MEALLLFRALLPGCIMRIYGYGDLLRLNNIPPHIQEVLGVGQTADVIYTRFTQGTPSKLGCNGVRFSNCKEIAFDRLGPKIRVEKLPPELKMGNPPVRWNPSARDGVAFQYLGQMPDGKTVLSEVQQKQQY